MKVKLFISMLIVMSLCGCREPSHSINDELNDNRFVRTYEQTNGFEAIGIITDTKTGKEYLVVKEGSGTGMTLLEE